MKKFIFAAILFVNMNFVAAQGTIETQTHFQLLKHLYGENIICPDGIDPMDWTVYCNQFFVPESEARQIIDAWAKSQSWSPQNEWHEIDVFSVRDFTYLRDGELKMARFAVSGEFAFYSFMYKPYTPF